jgi:hypothetical protein
LQLTFVSDKKYNIRNMVKKAIFSFIVLLIFAGTILADGNDPVKGTNNVTKISGKVVDQITGETLAGVKVYIEGTDRSVYTNFDGEFQINIDLNKSQEISVALISYEAKTIKIENPEDLKISLERQK